MGLTETQLTTLAHFDADTLAGLRPALGAGIDAVSAAGALDLDQFTTELTVSGTVAYTLAAPTTAGQRKRIVCVSGASTPLGTVTISSPDDTTGFVLPSTVVFTDAGQSIDLVATSALKWRCVRATRAGVAIPVIGTTVLTGRVLHHTYSCSVTGTVSSTTTRALPNGLFPGDMCIVACSTAASTPIGNINFTGVTLANVAATDLQAIGATTDTVTLTWNGAAWLVIANSGITVA
jgi:hypothetical protein